MYPHQGADPVGFRDPTGSGPSGRAVPGILCCRTMLPRSRSTLPVLSLLAAVPLVHAGLGGKLLPIPAAFSYPETGPGGGAKLRWQDPFDKPGFADITAVATVRGQSNLELEVLRDSLQGLWRVRTRAEFGKFPAKWFGRGNPPPDDQEGLYTPIYAGGEFGVGRWLPGGWLAGAYLLCENWDVRTDGQGVFARERFTGDRGGLEANAGLQLTYEGRDLPENPRFGRFLDIKTQASIPGTDFDWRDVQIEASQAASLGAFTGVLRVRHEEAWGSIPLWRVPFLGWRKSLRGLPDKRLRGNVAQCVGTELRWNGPKIWIFPLQPAVFGELGRAGGHADAWTADPNWAAGGGLRCPLAGGKAVLRADYGWSEVGSGLYVDFGQAF